MAEALIKGMVRAGKKKIVVAEPREDRRRYLENAYHVKTTSDNLDAVKKADILVLAVKPQQMASVLDEISTVVTVEKTVVSIAAGITIPFLKERLKTDRLIRVMPNLAATVGEGITAVSVCDCFIGPDINAVKEIFMSVGRVIMMPEKHLNAVTALSGSGPAFIALFISAMIESGVKMGLSRDDAFALLVQTLNGTARLIDEGLRPETLIEMVKSPGGTTEAGLKVFDGWRFRTIVAEALLAAEKRAGELAK